MVPGDMTPGDAPPGALTEGITDATLIDPDQRAGADARVRSSPVTPRKRRRSAHAHTRKA